MAQLVDVWCVVCGDSYADVSGRCTRCHAVAIKGATQNTLDREAGLTPALAQPAFAPKPIRLPDTRATHRWLDETRSYTAALEQQATTAHHQAVALQREATDLTEAAATLSDLMTRLGVSKDTPTPERRPDGTHHRPRLGGRWSRAHERCVQCARTDRPHKANGYCSACHRSTTRRASA